jgi:hypothetical protein
MEQENTLDKVLRLIQSRDIEMVKLGIVLALAQGPDWCMTEFGWMAKNNNAKGRHDFPFLYTVHAHSFGFSKEGVVIYNRGGGLYCDYIYRHRHPNGWLVDGTIVNLDKDE